MLCMASNIIPYSDLITYARSLIQKRRIGLNNHIRSGMREDRIYVMLDKRYLNSHVVLNILGFILYGWRRQCSEYIAKNFHEQLFSNMLCTMFTR